MENSPLAKNAPSSFSGPLCGRQLGGKFKAEILVRLKRLSFSQKYIWFVCP